MKEVREERSRRRDEPVQGPCRVGKSVPGGGKSRCKDTGAEVYLTLLKRGCQ